jgi:hypothetical protein
MYDVTVMSDRLEPALAGMMSAIASPPYAAYVVSAQQLDSAPFL